MASNQKVFLNNRTDDSLYSDEIDFSVNFQLISRHKRLIGSLSLLGLVLGSVIALNTNKTWKGQFQIVVDLKRSNPEQLKSVPLGLLNSGGENALSTQVEILKSPSVLMNIFEFVKSKSKVKNDLLRFNSWKKKLKVELEGGTTILNLSYIDNEKDLILPVLNRISSTYQEYSGRKRLRKIELGRDYYTKQIALYEKKSLESLRMAQRFAIEQDLAILRNESDIDNLENFINVESIRADAGNRIRLIDQQLERVNNPKANPDEIIYISQSITDFEIPSVPDYLDINNIDAQLASLRLVYKESDETIQNLLKKRSSSLRLLKKQVLGHLIAQRDLARARLKSSERPKGILVRYRSLLAAASRDQKTLSNLEEQYQKLSLETARTEDPWELITNPTLLPNPVAPNRILLMTLGLIGGFISGVGAASISEKKNDLVFSSLEIEFLSQVPLFFELKVANNKLFEESIDLLVDGPLRDLEGSIVLIKIGDEMSSLAINKLNQYLKKFLVNRDFTITSNLREANQYTNILLLTALGVTKKHEIVEIQKSLSILNKPALGLLVLNELN